MPSISEPPAQDKATKTPTQAEKLASYTNDCWFFHNAEKETFITVGVKDHFETHPIKSKDFKLWLIGKYYAECGKAPPANEVKNELDSLQAKARYDGPELQAHVRIAGDNGNIYIDLANDNWQICEVTPTGWAVIDSQQAPVKFRRTPGMKALPTPIPGGSINELRNLINIGNDTQWTLLIGWLLMAFNPKGPYPTLFIHGEQGSAKSTLAKFIRNVIDPNSSPTRSEPKDPRDMMISAGKAWILSYDNLSSIPKWLSDALCRIATGGGFSTRMLYEDDEEKIFYSTRPVIVNGIEAVATRPDLLSRGLILNLPRIKSRENETVLEPKLTQTLPGIFGHFLDVIVSILKTVPSIKLENLPRLADFATWVTAAEDFLGWKPYTFIRALRENHADANHIALEAYAIVQPLIDMMNHHDSWQGTSSELLSQLTRNTRIDITRSTDWPKRPNVLSGQLARLAPNLRVIGIDVSFVKTGSGNDRRKAIHLSKVPESSTGPTPSTQENSPCHQAEDHQWWPNDFRFDWELDGLEEPPPGWVPPPFPWVDPVDGVDVFPTMKSPAPATELAVLPKPAPNQMKPTKK